MNAALAKATREPDAPPSPPDSAGSTRPQQDLIADRCGFDARNVEAALSGKRCETVDAARHEVESTGHDGAPPEPIGAGHRPDGQFHPGAAGVQRLQVRDNGVIAAILEQRTL